MWTQEYYELSFGGYQWTQTEDQITITFLVPMNTNSKQIVFNINNQILESGVIDHILTVKGKLSREIIKHDCLFQFEKCNTKNLDSRPLEYKIVSLHIEKKEKIQWEALFSDDGGLDYDPTTYYNLAEMYYSLISLDPNEINSISDHIKCDPIERIIEYYRIGSDKNHLSSMLKLAAIYENGVEFLNIKRDTSKSIILYIKASEFNSIEATYFLGMRYSESGIRDDEKSLNYFDKCISVLRNMLPEIPQDFVENETPKSDDFSKLTQKSVNKYAKFVAINLHYLLSCCIILSSFYISSLDKDKIKRAFHYYKIASYFGDITSIRNIGTMYEQGILVEKSLEKANHWFNLSKDIDSSASSPSSTATTQLCNKSHSKNKAKSKKSPKTNVSFSTNIVICLAIGIASYILWKKVQ